MAPDSVAEEVAEHLPTLARKRGLDLDLLLAVLTVMPISWRAASEYEAQRTEAERRIAKRDPDDWPTVALALTHDIPIWSQDRDLEVAGLPLFTTGQLLDAIRTSG